jgi:hypothetical protein
MTPFPQKLNAAEHPRLEELVSFWPRGVAVGAGLASLGMQLEHTTDAGLRLLVLAATVGAGLFAWHDWRTRVTLLVDGQRGAVYVGGDLRECVLLPSLVEYRLSGLETARFVLAAVSLLFIAPLFIPTRLGALGGLIGAVTFGADVVRRRLSARFVLLGDEATPVAFARARFDALVVDLPSPRDG